MGATLSGEHVERRLAAILAADVAGSCRLMGIDEEGTLARLKALRRTLFDPKIAEHHGRIVKNTGDGAIAEFASVVDAVRCADEIQRGMAEQNIAEPMRVWRVPYGRAVPAVPTRLRVEDALALPDKPSIAVLPFTNLSSDPEQEYFADGMVDDIITALSHFKALFVIARNSSFTYKGRAVDVKQVGRELGVRYVLEGSVRK